MFWPGKTTMPWTEKTRAMAAPADPPVTALVASAPPTEPTVAVCEVSVKLAAVSVKRMTSSSSGVNYIVVIPRRFLLFGSSLARLSVPFRPEAKASGSRISIRYMSGPKIFA